MDMTTTKLLEFDKIKELIAEYAISGQGRTMISRLEPSTNINTIRALMQETSEAATLLAKSAALPLHSLTGTENVMLKLEKNSILNPEELLVIHDLLRECKRLKKYMKERQEQAPRVSAYALSLAELDGVREEIGLAIVNGQVADRYSHELAKIRKRIAICEGRIKARLENCLRSQETVKYLQEKLVSLREGRYVIPVKAEYKNFVRGSVIDCSASGSTVFIEPEEIRNLQSDLALAKAQEEKEVQRILAHLTGLVENWRQEIMINIEVMAQYDLAFAKAKYSRAIDGTEVQLNKSGRIRIKGGKHPLIGSSAVPLDLAIGDEYQALIITGPNTGGKTVVLKTVGLLTLMVQAGLHVPVEPGSEFAVFDLVLADMGDGQDIQQSLSTFSAHIRNIRSIVESAAENTLVMLDELGAGTDPAEGAGLAIAILEALWAKGATILGTTHFNDLKKFAATKKGFENGAMAFDLVSLKPLYRLHIGDSGESNALLIAFRLGLDRAIVERAHQITYKENKEYLPGIFDQEEGAVSNPEMQRAHEIQAERKREEKTARKKVETFAQKSSYNLGDCVLIKSLGKTGIVCVPENRQGEVGVLFQGKRLVLNKNRIALHIPAKELYPEDYDFDIILESKETRKKRKIMSKRHVEGLILEHPQES